MLIMRSLISRSVSISIVLRWRCVSRAWIFNELYKARKKIRRWPDFFVALRNFDSSDNICALFQKSNGF